jgi:molybdate transport system regulatory protein
MLADKNRDLSYKVIVQCNNQIVLDQDGVAILETIDKTHSILKTAKTLNVSYRYVWNYIQRIQKLLNQPVVETFKGGKDGGGGTKLTKRGITILLEYRQVERCLNALLYDTENFGGELCENKCKKPV